MRKLGKQTSPMWDYTFEPCNGSKLNGKDQTIYNQCMCIIAAKSSKLSTCTFTKNGLLHRFLWKICQFSRKTLWSKNTFSGFFWCFNTTILIQNSWWKRYLTAFNFLATIFLIPSKQNKDWPLFEHFEWHLLVKISNLCRCVCVSVCVRLWKLHAKWSLT